MQSGRARRIAIADDSPTFVDAAARYVGALPGYALAGTAHATAHALTLVSVFDPRYPASRPRRGARARPGAAAPRHGASGRAGGGGDDAVPFARGRGGGDRCRGGRSRRQGRFRVGPDAASRAAFSRGNHRMSRAAELPFRDLSEREEARRAGASREPDVRRAQRGERSLRAAQGRAPPVPAHLRHRGAVRRNAARLRAAAADRYPLARHLRLRRRRGELPGRRAHLDRSNAPRGPGPRRTGDAGEPHDRVQ